MFSWPENMVRALKWRLQTEQSAWQAVSQVARPASQVTLRHTAMYSYTIVGPYIYIYIYMYVRFHWKLIWAYFIDLKLFFKPGTMKFLLLDLFSYGFNWSIQFFVISLIVDDFLHIFFVYNIFKSCLIVFHHY